MRYLADAIRKKERTRYSIGRAVPRAREFPSSAPDVVERARLTRLYTRLNTSRLPNAVTPTFNCPYKIWPIDRIWLSRNPVWEHGGALSRIDLADPSQMQCWFPTTNDLAAHLIRTPGHLAHLVRSEVIDLSPSSPAENPVLIYRMEASIQTGGPAPERADGPSLTPPPAHLEPSFSWGRLKRLNQTAVSKARGSSDEDASVAR